MGLLFCCGAVTSLRECLPEKRTGRPVAKLVARHTMVLKRHPMERQTYKRAAKKTVTSWWAPQYLGVRKLFGR